MKISENGVGYNGRPRPSDDKPTLTPDYASVQRFVIPAADFLRVLILPVQPNEVEHVFALDRAYRPNVRARLPNESTFDKVSFDGACCLDWTSMSVALIRISSRSRQYVFAFRQSVVAR